MSAGEEMCFGCLHGWPVVDRNRMSDEVVAAVFFRASNTLCENARANIHYKHPALVRFMYSDYVGHLDINTAIEIAGFADDGRLNEEFFDAFEGLIQLLDLRKTNAWLSARETLGRFVAESAWRTKV